MKDTRIIEEYLSRFPFGALIIYIVVVLSFLMTTSLFTLGILERRQAVAETADILSHLEGRNLSQSRNGEDHGPSLAKGSPFVDGPSVTVAGATLLERVAGSVTRFGGTILSSQVDLQGARSKDGFVKVSVECEVDQPSLQNLLYDLESGMPFLFIDQLVAQTSEAARGTFKGKMRVSILVAGQWQGAK